MGKLQQIENELGNINDAVFQELCDRFLLLRNRNYSTFSRTGSQSGKQKTIPGRPDSFFRLPSGKYIFVEHSTNISEGLKKLKRDINDCLNEEKTGVSIKNIEEIILCFNFNLTASKDKELTDLLLEYPIALSLYSKDALANELYWEHKNLVHEFLGLPFDSGQIISIEQFIKAYDERGQGIATPLGNEFLHRERETKELSEAISGSDFVILSGSPGVGKTKLAIETIRSFLSDNLDFNAYCIFDKSYNLLEDLDQYLNAKKNYILFVDDANRIGTFSQIKGFYKAYRTGRLKIIITVRDYALRKIELLCNDIDLKVMNLPKLSDDEITNIIKSDSFKILSYDFQKTIVRIADGNPRIAIMAARLASKTQNIFGLSDVSDLFEKYFSTLIADDQEFATAESAKYLGLVAFFYTMRYKDKAIMLPILQNFGLEYDDFIEGIDRLSNLELIDIQYEHVKIPEQNLATYFFYKSFIRDNLLPFSVLLKTYFVKFENRFIDCVVPANNTFGPGKVMEKLRPTLIEYYYSIKNNNEIAYKLLAAFWYYLQDETMEFLYTEINKLPTMPNLEYLEDYEGSDISHLKDDSIILFSNLFRLPERLREALQLSIQLVKKKPDLYAELIYALKRQFTFDVDDAKFGFNRQDILFKFLNENLKQDRLFSIIFLELAKTFLLFCFHHTKSERRHQVTWYNYPLPFTKEIQQIRSLIWTTLEALALEFPAQVLKVLISYSKPNSDVSKEFMDFDIKYIVNMMENYLDSNNFEHCKYVQEQIKWCQKNAIEHSAFQELTEKFRCPTYEVFLKVSWDRHGDKEVYDFANISEYERIKEAELRSAFSFIFKKDFLQFYEQYCYLQDFINESWNWLKSLDIILDEIFISDFDLGCECLSIIIEKDNEINFVPNLIFDNHLNQNEKQLILWKLTKAKFKGAVYWKLSYFENLHTKLITKDQVANLVKTIEVIKEPVQIMFFRLEKYLSIEPNLFKIILKIVTMRNESENLKIRFCFDLFDKHFEKLGDDINLIEKAYFQQDEIMNFDYNQKAFIKILKKDHGFLLRYLQWKNSEGRLGASDSLKKLSFVWEINNGEVMLKQVFDFFIEKTMFFGGLDHFCNSFFIDLSETAQLRADEFLEAYLRDNFLDSEKVNLIIDIVRHTRKHLFEPFLLLYLTLNQDKEAFSRVWWKGHGRAYSGEEIIGDIEASEWQNILNIVKKSSIGIQLIPIKKYIQDQIDSCLKSGDWERQRKFLERA